MVGAPQQANSNRSAASIGIELISKADTLSRLVDDPGDASGFDSAEIGYVVVMRKVDNQRVDHCGRRFAALFHYDEGTPSYRPLLRTQALTHRRGLKRRSAVAL
jgi:hypothetical protein